MANLPNQQLLQQEIINVQEAKLIPALIYTVESLTQIQQGNNIAIFQVENRFQEQIALVKREAKQSLQETRVLIEQNRVQLENQQRGALEQFQQEQAQVFENEQQHQIVLSLQGLEQGLVVQQQVQLELQEGQVQQGQRIRIMHEAQIEAAQLIGELILLQNALQEGQNVLHDGQRKQAQAIEQSIRAHGEQIKEQGEAIREQGQAIREQGQAISGQEKTIKNHSEAIGSLRDSIRDLQKTVKLGFLVIIGLNVIPCALKGIQMAWKVILNNDDL